MKLFGDYRILKICNKNLNNGFSKNSPTGCWSLAGDCQVVSHDDKNEGASQGGEISEFNEAHAADELFGFYHARLAVGEPAALAPFPSDRFCTGLAITSALNAIFPPVFTKREPITALLAAVEAQKPGGL
jgi:hypothetical protein